MVELVDILDGLVGKTIISHHQAFWEDEADLLDIYQISSIGCAYKDFRAMYPDADDNQIEDARTFLKPEKGDDCSSCGSCSGGCDSCGCNGDEEEFKLNKARPQGYIGIAEDDELVFYNVLFMEVWRDDRSGAILMKKRDVSEALEIAVLYQRRMQGGGCSGCPSAGSCGH